MPAQSVESDFDWEEFRAKLHDLSQKAGHWCGIPTPVGDGLDLIVNPRLPYAHIFPGSEPDKEDAQNYMRNGWWSDRLQKTIMIGMIEGKLQWVAITPAPIDTLLKTLSLLDVWGFDQELTAVQTLMGLVSERQIKSYMLTGSFAERSPRSKLLYVFRRLRPTLAISSYDPTKPRLIAALCLHTLGYYAGSWGGAMVPTDDVISHLMMMRGDEKRYWRYANQHSPSSPLAGL